jgi:hypothetical protein
MKALVKAASSRRVARSRKPIELKSWKQIRPSSMDAGDVDRRPVSKHEGETPDILGLAAEVDLLSQVRPDLIDESHGFIVAQAWHEGDREARDPHEGAHIAIDLRLDTWAADLDDHVPSVFETGCMDLRDRGDRQRHVIEFGKDLTDGTSQAALDLGNGIPCRERSYVILQGLQSGDVIIGQQVAP